MHLPLSAGRIVTFWSLLSVVTAFLSSMVRLEGGGFALDRAADTFNLSSSASVSVKLFFFIADSVAVIKSTIGNSFGVKFKPLPKTSFSG